MSLLLAFKFLTVLPIPLPQDVPPKAMGRAAAYYPLVGAVLGLALVGCDWLLGLALPLALRSALVLALWVALTGALHLDGFLDCCDGLLAPCTPERRLEILRDAHVGSFAVVGAVLLLLVKFAALASLQGAWRPAVLGGAPVLGRWAMTYALVGYPYARPARPGLGGLVKQGAGRGELAVASAIALLATLVAWGRLGPAWGRLGPAGGWLGLAALPLTWAFTALVARWIMGRIPGLTGDTYGAICELVEVTWLAVLAAMMGRAF